MESISKTLKRLRGKKSLISTAYEIGITPSALSNYESGIRIPRDQTKVKIANYYGVSVESIFFNNKVHEK